MSYPLVYKLHGRELADGSPAECDAPAAIIKAEPVQTTFPARRCAAPGCGDKIKGDTMRLTLSTEPTTFAFVEDGCFDAEHFGVIDWPNA